VKREDTFVKNCFAVLALAIVSISQGRAQVLYGSISGTVADQSGALIPNATIKAVHKETSAAREVTSARRPPRMDGSCHLSDVPIDGTVRAAVPGRVFQCDEHSALQRSFVRCVGRELPAGHQRGGG